MRKLIYLPCIALLAAAAPATPNRPPVASPIAPSDPEQPVSVNSGGGAGTGTGASTDKKICRHLPSSSSRLPNRACLTAKEWKQVEEDLSH